MLDMVRVIIESPYAGDTPMHLQYLRACLADSVSRGESPYASHALLTQPGVLCDYVPSEREAGIAAGFVWRAVAARTVFCVDLGWSSGMRHIQRERDAQRMLYEVRVLGSGWHERLTERVKLSGATHYAWLASLRHGGAQ